MGVQSSSGLAHVFNRVVIAMDVLDIVAGVKKNGLETKARKRPLVSRLFRRNHVYAILNPKMELHKIGISSGKPKGVRSMRGGSQAKKLGPGYRSIIIALNISRPVALAIECALIAGVKIYRPDLLVGNNKDRCANLK